MAERRGSSSRAGSSSAGPAGPVGRLFGYFLAFLVGVASTALLHNPMHGRLEDWKSLMHLSHHRDDFHRPLGASPASIIPPLDRSGDGDSAADGAPAGADVASGGADLAAQLQSAHDQIATLQQAEAAARSERSAMEAQLKAAESQRGGESKDAVETRPEEWTAPNGVKVSRHIYDQVSKFAPIDQIPSTETVFITFTNGHYTDLALNLGATVAALGMPFIAFCFDDDAVKVFEAYNVPHMKSDEEMEAGTFRADPDKFRKMGSLKPKAVLKLFSEHNFQNILLIDTDTAWLKDPRMLMDQHPTADIFVSTDCLSHEAELNRKPQVARCGHVPGSGWNLACNTGIIFIRNNDVARAFMQEWMEFMLDPAKFKHGNTDVDDQFSFNLMVARGIYPIHATDEDRDVIWAWDNRLRLMVMPGVLIGNGHTIAYQHLHDKYQVQPYVMHATFQRHQNAGKRNRFREQHMWMLDPPAYYRGDRFMTYENDVHDYIAKVAPDAPNLYQWLLAASYQHAAFRDAAAIARSLDRALILPKVYSWCDWDTVPTVLERCAYDGADHDNPFHAPSDFIINLEVLEANDYVRFREHSFLDKPLAATTRHARETVQIHRSNESKDESAGKENAGKVHIAGWTDDTALKASLGTGRLASVPVLDFRGLQPGTFRGFAGAAENRAFNEWHELMKHNQKWCCSTQQWEFKKKLWDSWFFIMPEPLPVAEPWRTPTYVRPPHCDELPHTGDPVDPFTFDNHPCNFLKDAPPLGAWP